MEFWILHGIQQLHTPVLDEIMKAVTFLGNHGWFWCSLAFLLLFVKKTRRTGVIMLLAMAMGSIAGLVILKPLVGRLRPCWLDSSVALLIENPRDFSFPSGHTMASFAAALPLFWEGRREKIPFIGPAALVLAALIAFSRLYLFVHFPTDVLGGLALGAGSAWAAEKMMGRFCKAGGREE